MSLWGHFKWKEEATFYWTICCKPQLNQQKRWLVIFLLEHQNADTPAGLTAGLLKKNKTNKTSAAPKLNDSKVNVSCTFKQEFCFSFQFAKKWVDHREADGVSTCVSGSRRRIYPGDLNQKWKRKHIWCSCACRQRTQSSTYWKFCHERKTLHKKHNVKPQTPGFGLLVWH